MEMEKAELLKKNLTFDTTENPRWVGDVGKCFVDAETETVTIVGWREEMGSPINSYRLVIKPKPDGVSLVGYSDTSKPIKFKVRGISMDEALRRMLRAAENGCVAVAALAQTVVDHSPQYCDTEPRPVGRPPTVGGKRVQVYLDEASLEIAAKIGKSNTSEGIRVALKQAATTTNSAG